MKLKFPKKIKIGAYAFKVILDPKTRGANAKYYEEKDGKVLPATIVIGTFYLKTNPTAVFENIIHELKELIQIEQGVHYANPTEERSYEFHYKHKEHTDLCSRLAGLLEEFIQ